MIFISICATKLIANIQRSLVISILSARRLCSIALIYLAVAPTLASALSDTYDQLASPIKPDPTDQGYKIVNNPKNFKIYKDLPEGVSIRIAGNINGTLSIGRLIADKDGNYWDLPVERNVVVNSKTGEVTPSPYSGSIKCFRNGNLALSINNGRSGPNSFQYGKYGDALNVWEGTLQPPPGQYLNLVSCTLEPRVAIRTKDGMQLNYRQDLLPMHGLIGIIEGAPRASDTNDLPDAAKVLMQQKFTQGMGVLPSTENWVLIKPNGDEVGIINNPGETMAGLPMTYLPYLDAYFVRPGLRNLLPTTALARAIFGRLIYPDGHVRLFGVPDVIQIPRQMDHLYFEGTQYTRAGLVWKIVFKRNQGRIQYQGELEEGYYLQQVTTKTLLKLPELEDWKSPEDGCTLHLKREVVQRTPWMLFNTSHINVCTGE